MIKTFKHPKLNIYATDGYINEKGVSTYYVKFDGKNGETYEENLLIALGFEEVLPEVRHLGNGMVGGQGDGYIIDSLVQSHCIRRYRSRTFNGYDINYSCFHTKEQAQQFDKMMHVVRRIWKWKKENDDTEGGEYSLYYNRQKKKFGWTDYTIEYEYGFFLPRFSSSNDVHQLISDLGEELNNLLCWIPGNQNLK